MLPHHSVALCEQAQVETVDGVVDEKHRIARIERLTHERRQ
jgi:hypothetical protein